MAGRPSFARASTLGDSIRRSVPITARQKERIHSLIDDRGAKSASAVLRLAYMHGARYLAVGDSRCLDWKDDLFRAPRTTGAMSFSVGELSEVTKIQEPFFGVPWHALHRLAGNFAVAAAEVGLGAMNDGTIAIPRCANDRTGPCSGRCGCAVDVALPLGGDVTADPHSRFLKYLNGASGTVHDERSRGSRG